MDIWEIYYDNFYSSGDCEHYHDNNGEITSRKRYDSLNPRARAYYDGKDERDGKLHRHS